MTRRPNRANSAAGITVIELIIAGLVFLICMLGVVPLFMIAIGNNGRGKLDTTSTELAQSVIEQVTAVLARGGPSSITDCGSPHKAWPIYTAPTPAGQVPLNGSVIDFTAAKVAGYQMDFAVCGDSSTNSAVYDVRWRIDPMPTSTTYTTYLVTVSARPKMMPTQRFAFALPVTLRTYVGKQ